MGWDRANSTQDAGSAFLALDAGLSIPRSRLISNQPGYCTDLSRRLKFSRKTQPGNGTETQYEHSNIPMPSSTASLADTKTTDGRRRHAGSFWMQ